MKSSLRLSCLLSSILLASALVGCAANASPDGTYSGTIKQESLSDLSNAPACDLETACPAGLACTYVGALDLDTAICVDSATACDALECGDGECLMLESYPAQLMCSGSTPDDDGSSDCTVSSDGTMDCPVPDGNSGDGEGSEPGNPGPA